MRGCVGAWVGGGGGGDMVVIVVGGRGRGRGRGRNRGRGRGGVRPSRPLSSRSPNRHSQHQLQSDCTVPSSSEILFYLNVMLSGLQRNPSSSSTTTFLVSTHARPRPHKARVLPPEPALH